MNSILWAQTQAVSEDLLPSPQSLKPSFDSSLKIGVTKIVLLVNGAFVPCQKEGFDEKVENDEVAFYPIKIRALLLRPRENDENGDTPAKAWFTKSRVSFVL